jgi:hypothetical protein
MLTIEFGTPHEPTLCADCGGTTSTLTRFVHKDGEPHAIYYARFSNNHPRGDMALAVGLGEFGTDSPEAERHRVSFGLVLYVVDLRYQVAVVEPEQSPWSNARVIGRMLTRTEALAHPRIKEVFHITDHMVTDDPEIMKYFEARLKNA